MASSYEERDHALVVTDLRYDGGFLYDVYFNYKRSARIQQDIAAAIYGTRRVLDTTKVEYRERFPAQVQP